MTVEEWRPVPGLEGAYEVSSLGRVRSLDRVVTDRLGRTRRCPGRVLTPWIETTHHAVYRRVNLGRRTPRIHVLVCEAWHGPRPTPKHEVCHGPDGTDDRPENLRWGTRQDNALDIARHGGRRPKAPRTVDGRGHRLVPPNLEDRDRYQKNTRSCLACARAGAHARQLRKRGVAVDVGELADQKYTKIMAGEAAA